MKPSPEQLLRNFVRGPNSEAAFAQLVSHFEKLIYSSALRRTNNPSLSEDITQAVLTILARKAKSLLNHPCLSGWVFQTTKLETMKNLRTEFRRNRKHQSYRQEPDLQQNVELNNTELSAWQEALPRLDQSLDHLSQRDRDLILRRFFSQEKFRDIARATHSTEGACKMQLKRALERLASHLTTGNSLSVSAIASALTLNLASAPPAKAGSLLASQVLTQAATLKETTLLTNTFLTMTSSQKSIAIGALLIVATSVPAIQMASEASHMKKELATISAKNESLRTLKSASTTSRQSTSEKRITYDIFHRNDASIDALSLLQKLAQSKSAADLTQTSKLILPILDLNEEDLVILLKDINECSSYPDQKNLVLTLIVELHLERDSADLGSQIEAFTQAGSSPTTISPILIKWAAKTPVEALAWFQEKDETGFFNEKGIGNPRETIYANLISIISYSNPALGSKLYRETTEEVRSLTPQYFIAQIQRDIQASENLSSLETYLSIENNPVLRQEAVQQAANTIIKKTQSLDEGLAVLRMADGEIQEFPRTLTVLANDQKSLPLAQKLSFLEKHLTDDQLRTYTPLIFEQEVEDRTELNQWLEQNPTSPFIDEARQTVAYFLTERGEYQTAHELAAPIREDEARAKMIDYINQSQQPNSEVPPFKIHE